MAGSSGPNNQRERTGEAEQASAATVGDANEQRRIEALRQLARAHTISGASAEHQERSGSSPARPSIQRRAQARPLQRRWWVWLSGAIALVLVTGVLVAHLIQPKSVQQVQKPSAVQVVTITPASDLIACPTSLSWSPDQRKIAVIGYATGCPFPIPPYNQSDLTFMLYQEPLQRTDVGYIAIYDAYQGTHLAAFSPDSAILASFHQQGLISAAFTAWLANAGDSPDQFLAIKYTGVIWSADQRQIFVVFTCYIPDGPPTDTAAGQVFSGHIVQGLEIVDVDGTHPQVLLHVGGSLAAGTAIWDLTTKQVIATLPASAPFALQPAAISYFWADNGALAAHGALSTSGSALPPAPATGSVGAPGAGSASFSVWQPGIVATVIGPQLADQQNLQGLRGVGAFATDFAALSPSGRYLATSIGLAGLLTSAASPAELVQYGWQAAPRLPIRDAGLRAALALANQSGFTSSDTLTSYVRVAWRPDGRELAVSANTATHGVTIFDCASGKSVKTLVPPAVIGSTASAITSLIEWSPDGHRLAFYDPTRGTLSLWGSDSTPV